MDPNAKQQVVERLKSASNVLVTVSNNPSVDALAAAIGFSLLLSKLGKHATAVFSGAVPPAIEFLQPGNRFDKDVTGLRDFIIALDKDKADKLRYKVEDNVVKIFITPYRTTISQADLRFEEGDFNVDAVVALGVQKREDLDNAIKAHGRILHDASVMTVNAGDNTSSLGAVDWQDPAAGSLSEMLVSVTESFGSGLLDEQMSTAFLTGIVAETERFSNPKTSPKVMTMAAQLMAAGANQQLIATNLDLQPAPTKPPPSAEAAAPPPDDSQISISHDDDKAPIEQNKTESSQQLPTPLPAPPPPIPADDGSSDQGSQNKGAPHEKTLQELESEISNLAGNGSKSKPTEQNAQNQEQPEPNKQQPPSVSGDKPKPITDSYNGANTPATPTEPTGAPEQNANKISNAKGRGPRDVDDDPTLGGTFNATSERAHEDNVADLRKNLNAKLLSHPGQPLKEEEAPPEDRPTSRAKDLQPLHQPPKPQQPNQNQPPNNAPSMPSPPTQPSSQPQPSPPQPPQQPGPAPAPAPTPPAAEKAQTNDDIEAARKAVEEAVSSEPFNPANNPTAGSGSMPMQQQDQSQPVTPSEIAIDDSGNLRLPGTPPPNQESNSGEGGNNSQNFQMPQPPAGQ